MLRRGGERTGWPLVSFDLTVKVSGNGSAGNWCRSYGNEELGVRRRWPHATALRQHQRLADRRVRA
jgi:hypothetical protein